MKSKIKLVLIIISLVQTAIILSCAGPASVSVGVGVGRPYGVPPAGGSIWIGRPMPRTIYNMIPPETEVRYVHDQRVKVISH